MRDDDPIVYCFARVAAFFIAHEKWLVLIALLAAIAYGLAPAHGSSQSQGCDRCGHKEGKYKIQQLREGVLAWHPDLVNSVGEWDTPTYGFERTFKPAGPLRWYCSSCYWSAHNSQPTLPPTEMDLRCSEMVAFVNGADYEPLNKAGTRQYRDGDGVWRTVKLKEGER